MAVTAKFRKKTKVSKPLWSFVKGRLSKDVLLEKKKASSENCSLQELLFWLSASGEFGEEVRRFKMWERFFRVQSSKIVQSLTTEILLLAAEFQRRAKKELGQYTFKVEAFRKKNLSAYKGREDIIFCIQPEVIYHLNMVGALHIAPSMK